MHDKENKKHRDKDNKKQTHARQSFFVIETR